VAAQKIYIPVYKDGAWHYAVVTGTIGTKVPEGEPAVDSRCMTKTSPDRLQPTPPPTPPTP